MDLSTLPNLEGFSSHTSVFIDPERLDDFWKAFTPLFETISATPECLYFEVFEDPAVPGKVIWVVNSSGSLHEMIYEMPKQDYHKAYISAVEPLFTKPPETRFLQRAKGYIAGKNSNFELVIGENNEGGCLHVSVEIDPENLPKFWEAWDKVFVPVAGEPECLYFEVFTDPLQPGKLSWFENWTKGMEWFMTQQATKEYYQPYLAATEPMFKAPRQFQFFKRKEGFVARKEANFEGSTVGDFQK